MVSSKKKIGVKSGLCSTYKATQILHLNTGGTVMRCKHCNNEMFQMKEPGLSRQKRFACIFCGVLVTIKTSATHPDVELAPRTSRPLTTEDRLEISRELREMDKANNNNIAHAY